MKIILCGGGTEGHIMPNIALLPNLWKYFSDIIYFGENNSRESVLASENSLPFFSTQTVKFDRSNPLSILKIPFRLSKAVQEARALLIGIKPDIIFAKGGYASLPCALAGKKLKIPVICHESDMSLGVANKLIDTFSYKTVTSYPMTKAKHAHFIGNPVREDILKANKNIAIKQLNLPSPIIKKILLIVGGSTGAKAINDTVSKCLDALLENYIVIHLLGKDTMPKPRKDYYPISYVKNIFDYYDLCDIAVSRCGANCAGELMQMHKKTLFIPLQNKASRGDQLLNANYYASINSAMVLPQTDLTAENLLSKIKQVEYSDFEYVSFRKDINESIAKLCYDKAKEYHFNKV